ncbi:rhodanese-like domain-containing protein [Pseudodesulfovibrio sp. JC047]|uniref:rhodanese-like domain-containing protein n=1 Tax=Pseudodesulfovibrio sp. JC047 TaxID=2683199 RepID=UPI0013D1189C|nr:rhodanese-like domain-containing protein [Pseudodesulfovibrio sp. JC047]NDV19573.1 rhodanese-like domain-containing protein [Pseudodesulfovibrio sp. JC047]
MKIKKIVSVLILSALVAIFFVNLNSSLPDGYVNIDAVSAQARLESGAAVTVLDVRTPAEFKAGHIQGAVNIDYQGKLFESQLEGLDRDAQYLVYCRTGNRSTSALKLMHRQGFSMVWHLAHGIEDWTKKGLPLDK